MSEHRRVVIDSDRHVQEPSDLWSTRMAADWGDRAPLIPEEYGRAMVYVDGVQVVKDEFYQPGTTQASLKDARYAPFVSRRFSPETQLESMDVDGIDISVLFPTKWETRQ